MPAMGRSDRRMHRAVGLLDQTYAAAFARERLDCGRLVAGGIDADVLAALNTIHDRCLAAALATARREGGPTWMARAGLDEPTVSARLWAEHGEPLTAVTHQDLNRS
jgi:hypothetical protein